MQTITRNLPRIAVWTVVLGLISTLIADGLSGEWDRFLPNLLWRMLFIAIGGFLGLLLNFFAGNYVSMGTNVIESTGMIKFGEDKMQKIENGFVFTVALTAAILTMIFIH